MLRNEAISYHFQPIFSAKDGTPLAYEALMRLSLPTLKSPLDVLRLARAENKLHDIERITLFKASEAYDALQRSGKVPAGKLLFINTIASQHLNEAEENEFVRRFSHLLPQYVSEITEEDELDMEALEKSVVSPAALRSLHWMITEAASTAKRICWHWPHIISRWIFVSSAALTPTRTSSRSWRTLSTMRTSVI